jgi:hypothetical protein
MAQKFYAIITTILVALLVAACGESDYFENAPVVPVPGSDTVYVKTPISFDITVNGDTTLLDEDDKVIPGARPDSVVIYMWVNPDTAKVGATQPWALHETEANPKTPGYEGFGGKNSWAYNHGTVVVEYRAYAVLKNGRRIPLYKPERLKEKQEHVKTETDGSTYSVSDVKYSLLLNKRTLAAIPEVLMTEVGYVDEFVGPRVLRQTHQIGSGVYDPATGVLTCLDSLFVAELWTSGYKNEQALLVHMQNHILVSVSGQVVADINKTVGKSWTGNSANLGGFIITETWQSKNTRESKLEATMNGQNYNFIDSVHVCKWTPNGGKVETAKKVRLDFAREGEPADKCNGYLDVNIEQNEVQEVKFLEAKHILFPKEAVVNTTSKTINVDHKDRAWFLLTYKDNTTGKDSVNYDVNHLFSYSVVNHIPAELKGNTLDIDANGNVKYNGKVIMTITLKSRTVKNLTYRGKDYTSSAAECDLTPKKAFFGENEITITKSHENENVTGKIPATYNSVKTYKQVGQPYHKDWNGVSSTIDGFSLTCNNFVKVVEVMMDDSEGQTFELPYTSYNYWKVIGMISAEVENIDSYMNVPVAIVNGVATLAGSSMSLSHSMKADKVTKGNFSYQPDPCEAVAKYLTPISASQGRIDLYHGTDKVGSFIVPISLTKKPIEPYTFDGKVCYAWVTMSVVDGSSVAVIDAYYLHVLVLNNGVYTVYARKYADAAGNVVYDSNAAWDSIELTAEQAARVSANHPLAFTGKTPKAKWGYIDMDKTYKIDGSNNNYGITYMNLLTGAVSRKVGMSGSTIDSAYPYPVLGTWSNGKIDINGNVLYINGSQN